MSKRANIDKEIEELGDGYRDILRAGWVKYLANVNAHGSKKPQSVPTVVSKTVVDED